MDSFFILQTHFRDDTAKSHRSGKSNFNRVHRTLSSFTIAATLFLLNCLFFTTLAKAHPTSIVEGDLEYSAPTPKVRWWGNTTFHQQQMGTLRVLLSGSGLVRNTFYAAGKDEPQPGPFIVRSQVDLDVEARGNWGGPKLPLDELRYQYILHTPGLDGQDIQVALSAVLTGGQAITWDTTNVADGTYAISVRIFWRGCWRGEID